MDNDSSFNPILEDSLRAFTEWWQDRGHASSTGLQYCREVRTLVDNGYLMPPDLTLQDAREFVRTRWPNTRQVESAKITIRALKAFSRWRAAEFQDTDHLDALTFPTSPTPVGGKIAEPREVDRLILVTAQDKSFAGHRDVAMIATIWSNGMRRSDLARLTVSDLDLAAGVAWIRKSKNGQGRAAPLSKQAVGYLRTYLVARARHPHASDRALWLSQRLHKDRDGTSSAALQPEAISARLEVRCRDAGVDLPSHTFRRGFAAKAKKAGVSDSNLMEICAWQSVTTLKRYTRQEASRIAIEEYRRLLG